MRVRDSSRTFSGTNPPDAGMLKGCTILVCLTHSRTGSGVIHLLRKDGTYLVHRLSDLGPPNLLRWRETVTSVCLSQACVHNVQKAIYVLSKTGLITTHLMAQAFDLVIGSLNRLIIMTSVYFYLTRLFLFHFSFDHLR